MAKKSKDDVPGPSSVANRDILQRLNFLYQASQMLGAMAFAQEPEQRKSIRNIWVDEGTLKREMNRRRHPASMAGLSRSYVESMKSIGTKTNVRMDPSVKRTICKGCNMILVPGVTEKVRIKSSRAHGHAVTYFCMTCNTSRQIPAPPLLDTTTNKVTQNASTAQQAIPDSDLMDVDNNAGEPGSSRGGDVKRSRRRRKKRHIAARQAPFFERDIGHVVFRGNELLA